MRKGCTDYFGAFEIHGTKNIKHPEQQHMVAIHPHGPTAFSRMYFIGGFRELLKGQVTNDVSCIFGILTPTLIGITKFTQPPFLSQKLAYPPSTPEC